MIWAIFRMSYPPETGSDNSPVVIKLSARYGSDAVDALIKIANEWHSDERMVVEDYSGNFWEFCEESVLGIFAFSDLADQPIVIV